MKLCYSTLGCTENSLSESLSLAKVYGMNTIEIRGIGGCLHNTAIPDFSKNETQKTKELFEKYGVKPLVLGTSCQFHNPAVREAALKEGRESAEIANRLGIPYLRVFGNNLTPDPETATQSLITGLGMLCKDAGALGVTVLLEVHGDFNTIEALEPVVQILGSNPSFGLIWDVGHTHRVYGECWEAFYSAMRPFIRHVHIKDFSAREKSLVLPGRGDIPLISIMRRMLADGWDGYFSLEWERKWVPALPPMEEALQHFTEVAGRV